MQKMVAVGPSDPVKGAKVIHFRFCHFPMQRFPSQDLNDCYNLPYLGIGRNSGTRTRKGGKEMLLYKPCRKIEQYRVFAVDSM
jgi:hypothetical protein